GVGGAADESAGLRGGAAAVQEEERAAGVGGAGDESGGGNEGEDADEGRERRPGRPHAGGPSCGKGTVDPGGAGEGMVPPAARQHTPLVSPRIADAQSHRTSEKAGPCGPAFV